MKNSSLAKGKTQRTIDLEALDEITREAVNDVHWQSLDSRGLVRVSGPLTSGPHSYEENTRRFRIAEEKLSMMFSVFTYHKYEERLSVLYGRLRHGDIMKRFHKPVLDAMLSTGRLKMVFMLPDWGASTGACFEHDWCQCHGVATPDVPPEWFK